MALSKLGRLYVSNLQGLQGLRYAKMIETYKHANIQQTLLQSIPRLKRTVSLYFKLEVEDRWCHKNLNTFYNCSIDKDLQTMPHTFPQLGKELMLHQQPHHRALVGAMIPAHRPPQLNSPLTSLKTPSNTLRKHDKTLANQFKSLKHVKTC